MVWNECFGRCFSFSRAVFSGSMLIFQGVNHMFFLFLKESNGTINAVLGVDEVLADDFSDLIPPMYSNLLTFTIKIKQM